jgi:protein-L-isoaspartate(D-aspartate) O-methyltransferase
MLRPAIEGRLLVALDLQPDSEVLLIGTGSGYLAAVLARLALHVTAIDKYEELTTAATAVFAAATISNATLLTADYQRYSPGQQFDRILVSGSLPSLDDRLLDWLTPTGTLVATLGTAPCMTVQQLTRAAAHYSRKTLFETVLPPLEVDRTATSTPAKFRF